MSEGQTVLPFPVAEEGKQCTKCGEWKTFGEYGRDESKKDGRQSHCMPCVAARFRESRWTKRGIPEAEFPRLHREHHQAEADRAFNAARGMKRCTNCDAVKPQGDFTADARKADGLASWCKGCVAASTRESRWTKRGIPETDFPRLHAEAIAATLHAEGMRARAKAVGGKWCPSCDDILPRRAFSANAAQADGLASWCRECQGEAQAAYAQTPEGRAACIAKDARREARKRGQPVDGSGIPDWLDHHEETDTWFCHLCGGAFLPGDVIEWDHRDPLSDRFTGDEPKAGHVVANLAAAHKACNNSRSDTPLDVWHERVGVPDGVV